MCGFHSIIICPNNSINNKTWKISDLTISNNTGWLNFMKKNYLLNISFIFVKCGNQICSYKQLIFYFEAIVFNLCALHCTTVRLASNTLSCNTCEIYYFNTP